MNIFLKISQKISFCMLAAMSFSAMATDTFTLNGRAVQLESAAKGLPQSKSTAAGQTDARVTVRDVASGKLSFYAEGLIITLKSTASLKPLLQDYPALILQYAPGTYAYVQVPREALAATVNALGADARVAAVHLRPVPVAIKPR